MSKQRYRWWGYVRNVIRAYPELDAKFAAACESLLRRPRHRLTQEQREYIAVRRAIAQTEAQTAGEEHMRFIAALYFEDKPRRIDRTYQRHHISEATAWRWHREFVCRVARELGLLDGER